MEKKRLSDYRALARMTMKGHYGTMLLAVIVVYAIQMIISQLFSGFAATQSVVMLAAFFVLELMVSIIILGPLSIGLNGFFISCISGEYEVRNIFNPFTTNLTNTVKVYFFMQLKLFLWLIVPWLIGMALVAAVVIVAGLNSGAVWTEQLALYLTELGELLQGTNTDIAGISAAQLAVFAAVYLCALGVSLLFMIPGIIKTYEYAMIPYIVAEDPDISVKEAFMRTKIMMQGNKLRYFGLIMSFIGWFLLGMLVFVIGVVFVIPYLNAAAAHFYIDAKKKLGASGANGAEAYDDIDKGDTFGI